MPQPPFMRVEVSRSANSAGLGNAESSQSGPIKLDQTEEHRRSSYLDFGRLLAIYRSWTLGFGLLA